MRLRSALRSWLSNDPPDRDRLTQMRALWQVPEDWTIPQTAKVVPTRKAKTWREWMQRYGERTAA